MKKGGLSLLFLSCFSVFVDLIDFYLFFRMTAVFKGSPNPVWDEEWEMNCCEGSSKSCSFSFSLFHRPAGLLGSTRCLDDVPLGTALVDLVVLHHGLKEIKGWYAVFDLDGSFRGQIKVGVRPLRQ
jgi:hypothetical protein